MMNFLVICLTIFTLITAFKFGRYASNVRNLNDFAKTLFMGITLMVDSMFLIFAIVLSTIN